MTESMKGQAGDAPMTGMKTGRTASHAASMTEMMGAPDLLPFDIMTGQAGQWMVGYQFMVERMDRNLVGTHGINEAKILERYSAAPTDMTMEMHMPMIMYAPTDRLTLMAMLPYVTMSINVAESKEVVRIPVGKAPVQVAFLPDGRRAYVSLRDENSVAIIDTAQRKKIATVPVGRNPIQVFFTPDGRYVYVANQGSEKNPDNTVSVIETASNRVVATVKTGQGAHGVVISDDGSRAFIANTFASTVSVIDTATQKIINNFKAGKGSGGITFRSTAHITTP